VEHVGFAILFVDFESFKSSSGLGRVRPPAKPVVKRSKTIPRVSIIRNESDCLLELSRRRLRVALSLFHLARGQVTEATGGYFRAGCSKLFEYPVILLGLKFNQDRRVKIVQIGLE
jgi:hypothetical protein